MTDDTNKPMREQLDRIERGIRYLMRKGMYTDACDGLSGLALDDAIGEDEELNGKIIKEILEGRRKY